jgi:Fe-S oxidoreductase
VFGSLAGIDIVEVPRSGPTGRCCGAVGAQMSIDEAGTEINVDRTQELTDIGATGIVTACHFCSVMLDDGTKARGKGGP